MPYGKLTHKQAQHLREFVTGQVVHDLGCGDGVLAEWLAVNGAKKVFAVDTDGQAMPRKFKAKNITRVHCTIAHYLRNLRDTEQDVAFMSWPSNNNVPGLLHMLDEFRRIAYLGKNTDGTACGTPDLWRHLTRRALSVEEPDEHNTLLLYRGPELFPEPMLRAEEEVCGLLNNGMFKPIAYGALSNHEVIVDENPGARFVL